MVWPDRGSYPQTIQTLVITPNMSEGCGNRGNHTYQPVKQFVRDENNCVLAATMCLHFGNIFKTGLNRAKRLELFHLSSFCVLCAQCWQFLWIVDSWLPLRFSLMFIQYWIFIVCKYNYLKSNCSSASKPGPSTVRQQLHKRAGNGFTNESLHLNGCPTRMSLSVTLKTNNYFMCFILFLYFKI